VLPAQKHAEFIRLLNLVDIKDKLITTNTE